MQVASGGGCSRLHVCKSPSEEMNQLVTGQGSLLLIWVPLQVCEACETEPSEEAESIDHK